MIGNHQDRRSVGVDGNVRERKPTATTSKRGRAGYAAVWATDNTRAALFDAMERRETYATTGPRMIVGFFGGFEFEAADAQTRNPAITGFRKGVPMGGPLSTAPANKSPTFLVAAVRDAIGAT